MYEEKCQQLPIAVIPLSLYGTNNQYNTSTHVEKSHPNMRARSCVSDTRIQSRVHACEGSFSKLRHGPLPSHRWPFHLPHNFREKHTSFGVLRLGTAPSRSRRSSTADPVVRLFCLRHALPSLSPPRRHSPWRLCRCDRPSPNFRRAFPRQSSAAIPALTSTALLALLHSILACSFLLLTLCVQAVPPFSSRVLVITSLRVRASSCGRAESPPGNQQRWRHPGSMHPGPPLRA